MGEVARHIIILGNNTLAKTTLRVLRTSRYIILIVRSKNYYGGLVNALFITLFDIYIPWFITMTKCELRVRVGKSCVSWSSRRPVPGVVVVFLCCLSSSTVPLGNSATVQAPIWKQPLANIGTCWTIGCFFFNFNLHIICSFYSVLIIIDNLCCGCFFTVCHC